MSSLTTSAASTRGGRGEIAELTRRRAAALFPHAAGAMVEPESAPVPEPDADPTPTAGIGRRTRWRLALLERLPTAVQLRCGLELKAVAVLAVLGIAAVAFAVQHFWGGRPHSVEVPAAVGARGPAVPAASPGPPAQAERKKVVVDVAGKVHDPGVHKLPAGSRVSDALRAAGGVLPGTDTSTLNLARVLGDGEQVLVGAPGPAPGPGTGAGGSGGTAGPISLNSATAEQLDTLPGVGPVLAQHILDYRAEHGGFTSVDQLRDVDGIGEQRFSDLEPLVRP